MLQEFHRSSFRAISAGPEYAPQPRLRKAGEPSPSATGLFSCPTRTRALSPYTSALWAVWRATLDRRKLSPAAAVHPLIWPARLGQRSRRDAEHRSAAHIGRLPCTPMCPTTCQDLAMTKLALLTSAALLAAASAFAQTGTTTSSPPGASPSTATSGPASTGTVSPTTGPGAATGAETRSNNPAGASNAEQPERGTPQTGRGGGGGSGGSQ